MWSMRQALYAAAISVACLTFNLYPGAGVTADLPQVWFNMTNYGWVSGPPANDKNGPWIDGAQGWNKMFGDARTPLPDFMDHVQVLAAADIAHTPDDVLANAFIKLKPKHLPFAIESLAQSWVHQGGPANCGNGVESYTDPPGNWRVAQKLKAAGGELAIVAMDEPLFYGHFYDGRNACHSSIANVAERAVAIMAEYKKLFPQVVIGDIEPVPAIAEHPGWQNEYRQWMTAFSAAMGQPLAFLQIDINWSKPDWPVKLQETVAFARTVKLPFSIIYNGNVHGDPTPTNEKWLNSAVQNFLEIETGMRKTVFGERALYATRSCGWSRNFNSQAS